MKIFHKITEIKDFVISSKDKKLSVGFVPTMGALHQGHIELIKQSVKENDITICSIFVNPIQFNNTEDLEKYPRTLEADIKMLESANCSAVFNPSAKEMYPKEETTIYELGGLDLPMEGKFRPGHFNGVAVVVKRLFDIVTPHKAYFGEKDFQQLAIIQYLVKSLNLPVEIIPCSIVRESDGLAMSSRNMRLTENERKTAPFIYQTLKFAKENYKKYSTKELKEWIEDQFKKQNEFSLEYVEIVDSNSLKNVINWEDSKHVNICLAAFLGKVRLIDNIKIF